MRVKYGLSILTLLIVIVVVYIAILTHDRSIDTTIRGVNFQLGTEHTNNVKPEIVSIKGSVSKKLNGFRAFKGSITFEHDSIPVPNEFRDTTIHFDKNGYGPIVYGYIENAGSQDSKPKTYYNGVLFANSDFSIITYLSRDGWNGEDGLMFAGPATTREQAIIIANDLMKKFNGPFILK